MDLNQALKWLAGHVNREVDPSAAAAARRLDGIRQVLTYLDDPQASYPVVHITGTNGKGSTVRMVASLLAAHGLSVGTYTSPHLERLNERMAVWGRPIDAEDLSDLVGGLAEVEDVEEADVAEALVGIGSLDPIGDEDLREQLAAVAALEPVLDQPLSHFEVLTAAAFRWFADQAVDVAVVEVGLGGRWDSTNVADAAVAVVTNVDLDHAETIGPELSDIATEKAGIVKPDSFLVLGETDPDLAAIFLGQPSAGTWKRDVDFGARDNRLAIGGRAVDLWTPGGRYEDVFLPAHGAFQGDNAAVALAAAQAFFGRPLGDTLVRAAFRKVELRGRMEVVGREPLVVIDGAHNPAGARAASAALTEAFGDGPRILVVGMLADRDPAEMLAALGAADARLVFVTTASSPRARPAAEIAAVAGAAGITAYPVETVADAVARALEAAGPEDTVVIAGSLYVAGPARTTVQSIRPALRGPRPRS